MSADTIARSVILKDYLDEGLPGPEHFTIGEQLFPLEELKDNLENGGVIVEIKYFSADPYLRSTIKTVSKGLGAIAPGQVMKGFVSGKILASKNEKWQENDFFGASLPFTTYQVLSIKDMTSTVMWKLTGYVDEDHLSYGIGVLGMPGATAYGGLIDILRPKQGETIFISAASGAVGGLVGQLAKSLYNCKVVGSCGGPDKCELVKTHFHFDHAIDYKLANNDKDELKSLLSAAAPEGIDMYFENVGGIHFEAAYEVLRPFGRIAICGQIAEYNAKEPNKVSINTLNMIYTQQRIEGFLCSPWLAGARGQFLPDMHRYLTEGKIIPQETFFDGIDQWPLAFQALFTGKNVGKVVVRI